MSHIDISKENFQEEVINYKGKVLVDFWAPWCGPCMMLSPVLDEISSELKDKFKLAKINVDEQNELSSQYNVSGIPTVLIFENGQLKDTLIGFRQKTEYLNALNK
jgi:thioredoxin 1